MKKTMIILAVLLSISAIVITLVIIKNKEKDSKNVTPTAAVVPPLTATSVPTSVVEPTSTNVPTVTNTPVPTATSTPVPTATNIPASTATSTPVPTATSTPVPTATNTPVPTATNTPTPTATSTPTATPKPTKAPTATPTPTEIPDPDETPDYNDMPKMELGETYTTYITKTDTYYYVRFSLKKEPLRLHFSFDYNHYVETDLFKNGGIIMGGNSVYDLSKYICEWDQYTLAKEETGDYYIRFYVYEYTDREQIEDINPVKVEITLKK